MGRHISGPTKAPNRAAMLLCGPTVYTKKLLLPKGVLRGVWRGVAITEQGPLRVGVARQGSFSGGGGVDRAFSHSHSYRTNLLICGQLSASLSARFLINNSGGPGQASGRL